MSYNRPLNALIHNYLERQLSLEEFQDAYSALFLDKIPEEAFDDLTRELYASVHEKAEWASRNPSGSSRDVGWLTEEEFRSWLQGINARLPRA